MLRLGVAALGMYNRRQVHILSQELNEDVKFFKCERPVTVASGRALSQADLLLGSFFFVHKSKAKITAGAPEAHEESSAFEFLHNTFGEFLTADFILRRTVAEVEALKALEEAEVLRAQLEQRLGVADGFAREWFASLVYTPLFTRPVVLEMMREWTAHVLKERNLPSDSFVANLDAIILNQIKRLLGKREMPSIIRKETAQEGYRAPFGDHPLLGHIAIYSTNLILLRLIVCQEEFVFDENQIGTHADGARPWDRLTHIWRSWFSLDILNGITAFIRAERTDSTITIRAKDRFQVGESQNRLEMYLNVGLSLADNISSGLTGLLVFAPSKDNQLQIDEIDSRLRAERIDLAFQVGTKRLLQLERHVDHGSLNEYWHYLSELLHTGLQSEKFEELEEIVGSVRRAVARMNRESIERMSSRTFDHFRHAVDPRMAVEIATRNPFAGLMIWQVANDIGDVEWCDRFAGEFLEYGLRRWHPEELMERRPEIWVAWLQLARSMRLSGFRGHMKRGFFHPEFAERVLDPRYLVDLTRRNPDAALAWMEIAWEFAGDRFSEHFRERFEAKYLERAFDPRYLVEFSHRNPRGALVWLQLVRSFGGGRFSDEFLDTIRQTRLLEQAFGPRILLDWSQRDPESVLQWLEIAQEFGHEQRNERISVETLERMLDYVGRSPDPLRNAATFAVLIRFARTCDSIGTAHRFVDAISSYLNDSANVRGLVGRLPISALPDLHWLVTQTRNPKLTSALHNLAER